MICILEHVKCIKCSNKRDIGKTDPNLVPNLL